MKYPLYILALCFVLASCQKDDSTGDVATNSITSLFNGEEWLAKSYTVEYFLLQDSTKAPLNILIDGQDDTRLQLVLVNYEGNTGTFDLVGEYLDASTGYSSNNGSITISKFDLGTSKISANFNLDVKDGTGTTDNEISITEGSFTDLDVTHF